MKANPMLLALAGLAAGALVAQAQWVTQSFALKAGWNAVYLHVDVSHTDLETLVAADLANPILEVWRWVPAASTAQFVQSPQVPVESTPWASWKRAASADSLLQRLVGNSAYLVRVGTNVTTYNWLLKGRPLVPAYEWTTTGLNFLGFPTLAATAPTFESFLAQCPDLQRNAEIFYYGGGELGSGNPAQLYALRTARVNRGQAYWIRSGAYYNRYFAPFELQASAATLQFGTNRSAGTLRLRNLTAHSLTVSVQLMASETPPTGQTAIAGTPPLLVRGAYDVTNNTYACTGLPVGTPRSWTLAAAGLTGSETEVVLGLNRGAITNAPGACLAGVLRCTDSLGFAQIDVPVSAYAGDLAGLWVGAASVSQVGQYLKTYARGAVAPILVTNGTEVVTNDLVFTNNGAYVVTGLNTNLGAVPASYPLRLIVHSPGAAGPAVLLQRVFCGYDRTTNAVVTTAESVLDPTALASARRISAVHLPWTAANTPWPFDANLGSAACLTATVTDSYRDRASNPFVHGYHPDHNNLDSSFAYELPQGSESYTLERQITLQLAPPGADFDSLTGATRTLTGAYVESIRLLGLARSGGAVDSRTFRVAGSFALNRISQNPTLTLP
jgi:hypothetical protein